MQVAKTMWSMVYAKLKVIIECVPNKRKIEVSIDWRRGFFFFFLVWVSLGISILFSSGSALTSKIFLQYIYLDHHPRAIYIHIGFYPSYFWLASLFSFRVFVFFCFFSFSGRLHGNLVYAFSLLGSTPPNL